MLVRSANQASPSSQPEIIAATAETPQPSFADRVIELTNKHRVEKGLDPLTENDKLELAATLKAEDMKDRDYFDHVAPDGTKPWDFINEADYEYVYAGENLAKCYKDPEELVDSWMNSPKHRANILSAQYEEIGVGVVEVPNWCLLIVEMFAYPAP